MNWYSFTGTNPSEPTHYQFVTSEPTCTSPTEKMCALQANDSGGKPIITEDLKDEIINCLQNQINDTNVKLKSR